MKRLAYSVMLEPLPESEGGGWLALAPDLPGCITDGATPEEALQAIQGAIEEWIGEAHRLGRKVPQPTRRVA